MSVQVKLHSEIQIEVFGPNKIKDEKDKSVQLNKENKIETVEPKWQSTRENRILIKKGVNTVPEHCLQWNMIKACIAKELMTVGDTIGDKTPKKEKPQPKKLTKKTVDETPETPSTDKDELPKP
jgi:hypothetical protein